MSKLFEVKNMYDRVCMLNSAQIIAVTQCDGYVQVVTTNGASVDIDMPYEQFVTAWRKALDGDAVRNDPDPAQLTQCEDMRAWLVCCMECAKEYSSPIGFNKWRAHLKRV